MSNDLILDLFERIAGAFAENNLEVRLAFEEGPLGSTGITLYGVPVDEIEHAHEQVRGYADLCGRLSKKIEELQKKYGDQEPEREQPEQEEQAEQPRR